MKIFTRLFSPLARGGAVATLLAVAILNTSLSAREPTNWIFGFGIGAGLSQIDQKWSDSTRNGIGVGGWTRNQPDSSVKDWGVTWEFLAGYKHWLNDWVGFRYYANVGAQHYKDDIFTAGKVKAGIIEYTANADILLNFYNSNAFTFGILGGFGIGGASFDSPALDTYESTYGPSDANPGNFAEPWYDSDMAKTKKHHLSASLSVGARFNIFQKIRNVAARTCDTGADGRRTCRVPISYLEHSIELNAKFNMLTYYATNPGELIGVICRDNNQNTYTCSFPRPGYEIKNPYKFTLRYIFAF